MSDYKSIVMSLIEAEDDDRPVRVDVDDMEILGPGDFADPTSKGEVATTGGPQRSKEVGDTKMPGQLVEPRFDPANPPRPTPGIMQAMRNRGRQAMGPGAHPEPPRRPPPQRNALLVREFLPVNQQISNELFDQNYDIRWHPLASTPMYGQFAERDRQHFEEMLGVDISQVIIATEIPIAGSAKTSPAMMDVLWETIRRHGRPVSDAQLIEFPDEDPRDHRVENPRTYDLGGHRFYLSEDVYADGAERYRWIFWGPGGGESADELGDGGTRVIGESGDDSGDLTKTEKLAKLRDGSNNGDTKLTQKEKLARLRGETVRDKTGRTRKPRGRSKS